MSAAERASRPSILDVRGLEVRYGPVRALRGVSIAVPRGEIVALLGANGAGKSSLLAALAGLAPPRAGTLLLDGFPIGGLPPHAVIERGLVLVPQGRAILAGMSVEENLRLGAHRRRDRPQIRQDLEGMFRRFPLLRERRAAGAGTLDAFGQQLLALARGLMARPRLLLLDEPSLGLAPAVLGQVFAAVADLRQGGLSVLLAEQHTAGALAIAQHAYVLERGAIALAGPAAELAADPRLQPLALGGHLAAGV